jgi:hypothetical protein
MKRHLVIPLIAGAALASGLASADVVDHSRRRMILEVSADPRDGMDTVRLDNVRTDKLELLARNSRVDLHGVIIQFTNGRVMRLDQRRILRPGELVHIDVPDHRAIAAISFDYGRPEWRRRDRTDARLQVFALDDDVRDRRRYDAFDRHDDGRYDREITPRWEPEY